jgi:uncharacterized protein
MSKEFNPRRLDVKAFAQNEGHLEGREPLAKLPRLLAETYQADTPSEVAWSAAGEIRNARHVQPEVWLHLKAAAPLTLTCQRCLGPIEEHVAFERDFRFVADEDTAAAQDEEAEEDVLALDAAFDLAGLIEDEMLMELPLAPRHDICPEPVTMAAEDPDFDAATPVKENPFAALGKLKGGK